MSAPQHQKLRFAGYAALFNKIDRGGDIILPGAFADALARGRSIPLLWQHDPRLMIGQVEQANEDKRGLRIIAELADDRSDAAHMLAAGAVTGLSFGYRVRHSEGHRPRTLHALELVEVSLVSFPMQPCARVHLITS